jgi:hypothetical protein
VTSGLVSAAKRSSRSSVSRDSRWNVGSATNDSSSARLRRAVVANTVLEFSISPRSWSPRSVSAPKTTPVFAISRRRAASWRCRMSTATLASSANGPRLPSASLMSRPWPLIACACVCIHTWKASRVRGSNARKISSSSTVGEICVVLSRPPSGIGVADRLPGVSST